MIKSYEFAKRMSRGAVVGWNGSPAARADLVVGAYYDAL
jgi:hypothetical protein